MRVNTDIWGAESTWRRDADGFSSSSSVPDDMQFKRGQYDTIESYCSNSRLEVGKPIDYSICYAGQGEGMPLASMRTWNMNNSRLTATTYKRNVPTGWFFGHSTSGNYQTNLICSHDIFANNASSDVKDYYWTPNGSMRAYPKQPSARVIPIVSFPTRGCYFGIRCTIFSPSSNLTQNKWLSELQTGDWSAWKIISAWGELYTYNQSDADFSGVTSTSSNHCCVCSNTEFEFKSDTDDDALPVLTYAIFAYNSHIPIFGWIDNEYTVKSVSGTYHAMQRVFETTTVDSSYAPVFIDTVPNAVFNVVNYTAWGLGFEGYCDINVDNLEAIRKAAAAYGLFFTEKDPSTSALRTNPNRWVSNDMFCGVLDNQGIGRGEYTYGTNNKNNPVYNMDSSQDSKYNPDGKRNLNIYIGDSRVSDIYIGDKFVNSVYLGDCQL